MTGLIAGLKQQGRDFKMKKELMQNLKKDAIQSGKLVRQGKVRDTSLEQNVESAKILINRYLTQLEGKK